MLEGAGTIERDFQREHVVDEANGKPKVGGRGSAAKVAGFEPGGGTSAFVAAKTNTGCSPKRSPDRRRRSFR